MLAKFNEGDLILHTPSGCVAMFKRLRDKNVLFAVTDKHPFAPYQEWFIVDCEPAKDYAAIKVACDELARWSENMQLKIKQLEIDDGELNFYTWESMKALAKYMVLTTDK